MTTYQYASVMRATNSAGQIDEGDIHVLDGKKEDGYKDTFITDDKDVRAVKWERLKLIDLPEPMPSRRIMAFLNENFDEYLGDVVGDDDE